MSETEYEARVAGAEYVYLALGFFAYAVGSLLLPRPSLGGMFPAVGMLALLVVLSLRTPWSCRVGPRGVVLRFWVGGLVRAFLPKEGVRVIAVTESDWGHKTRVIRLTSPNRALRLVRWAAVANARFGVWEDHSQELLAAFRRHGYAVEDETSTE
jgi:hypothetical protein